MPPRSRPGRDRTTTPQAEALPIAARYTAQREADERAALLREPLGRRPYLYATAPSASISAPASAPRVTIIDPGTVHRSSVRASARALGKHAPPPVAFNHAEMHLPQPPRHDRPRALSLQGRWTRRMSAPSRGDLAGLSPLATGHAARASSYSSVPAVPPRPDPSPEGLSPASMSPRSRMGFGPQITHYDRNDAKVLMAAEHADSKGAGASAQLTAHGESLHSQSSRSMRRSASQGSNAASVEPSTRKSWRDLLGGLSMRRRNKSVSSAAPDTSNGQIKAGRDHTSEGAWPNAVLGNPAWPAGMPPRRSSSGMLYPANNPGPVHGVDKVALGHKLKLPASEPEQLSNPSESLADLPGALGAISGQFEDGNPGPHDDTSALLGGGLPPLGDSLGSHGDIPGQLNSSLGPHGDAPGPLVYDSSTTQLVSSELISRALSDSSGPLPNKRAATQSISSAPSHNLCLVEIEGLASPGPMPPTKPQGTQDPIFQSRQADAVAPQGPTNQQLRPVRPKRERPPKHPDDYVSFLERQEDSSDVDSSPATMETLLQNAETPIEVLSKRHWDLPLRDRSGTGELASLSHVQSGQAPLPELAESGAQNFAKDSVLAVPALVPADVDGRNASQRNESNRVTEPPAEALDQLSAEPVAQIEFLGTDTGGSARTRYVGVSVAPEETDPQWAERSASYGASGSDSTDTVTTPNPPLDQEARPRSSLGRAPVVSSAEVERVSLALSARGDALPFNASPWVPSRQDASEAFIRDDTKQGHCDFSQLSEGPVGARPDSAIFTLRMPGGLPVAVLPVEETHEESAQTPSSCHQAPSAEAPVFGPVSVPVPEPVPEPASVANSASDPVPVQAPIWENSLASTINSPPAEARALPDRLQWEARPPIKRPSRRAKMGRIQSDLLALHRLTPGGPADLKKGTQASLDALYVRDRDAKRQRSGNVYLKSGSFAYERLMGKPRESAWLEAPSPGDEHKGFVPPPTDSFLEAPSVPSGLNCDLVEKPVSGTGLALDSPIPSVLAPDAAPSVTSLETGDSLSEPPAPHEARRPRETGWGSRDIAHWRKISVGADPPPIYC